MRTPTGSSTHKICRLTSDLPRSPPIAPARNLSPACLPDAIRPGGHSHADLHTDAYSHYHPDRHAYPHADANAAAYLYPYLHIHSYSNTFSHPHTRSLADFGYSPRPPVASHRRAGARAGGSCRHGGQEISAAVICEQRDDR